MHEEKKLMEHHMFIIRTDRKSLYSQIKGLVHQAQNVADQELNQRRQALKVLLDHEDKIYEEEFANNVKSRIDEDIKERKDVLLKIKEENAKHELEFLKQKRIQQYMNSCYEIREALRHKEMQDIRECQFEQMLEKERAIRKEKDLEKYWLEVQNTNLRVLNEREKEEECLKKQLVKYVTEVQKIQQDEKEEKREKERQEKLKEKEELEALLEKLRLENFNRKLQGTPQRMRDYKEDLFKMMREKQVLREKEKQEDIEMRRQMEAEIKRLNAEDNAKAREKKKAFYHATLDFIRYMKSIRQFEEEHQQRLNDRIDDLRRVDICTKANILRERQRKARIAEQCYADLRKQIHEQYEMRLRAEAEHKECKMLENRFGREEIKREEILARRQKHRQELDKQIEELNRIRAAEEAKFSNDIQQASNDPQFCSQLAEEYIKEGIDYLEPHANWRILLCPAKQYVAKPPASSLAELTGQGAIPKKCIVPCGCIRGQGIDKRIADGGGDH